MNVEDIQEGMMIRVSNDISKTHSKHDSNPEMHEMKGRMRRVQGLAYGGGVRVYYDESLTGNWTFCPEDLSIPEVIPPSTPVMFDPTNIDKGD